MLAGCQISSDHHGKGKNSKAYSTVVETPPWLCKEKSVVASLDHIIMGCYAQKRLKNDKKTKNMSVVKVISSADMINQKKISTNNLLVSKEFCGNL